jgi:NADPH-dependent glutamate synthase beta subunit-like oxidoreductase
MKSGATPAQVWSQVPTANRIASVIKSVQKGQTNFASGASNATTTITEVDMDKSVVVFGGYRTPSDITYASAATAAVKFSNSTTITVDRSTTMSFAGYLPWTVVEYY